jgi:hypothetical protein
LVICDGPAVPAELLKLTFVHFGRNEIPLPA